MDNGFSLADAKAITDNSEGFGGSGWWIILLFLVLFGGGFGGFGNRGDGSLSTDFAVIDRKIDGLGDGICQAQYENARLQNQTDMNMMQGFNSLQALGAQCCCDLKSAIHAEGEQTRAMMRENEIQNLRDKLNDVQRDAALCGVMRYPTQATYSMCPPQWNNNCCY